MIVYLDSSALTKIYLSETGTDEILKLVRKADRLGTALITRAEIAAALSKGVRKGLLSEAEGKDRQREFKKDWPNLLRLRVTEILMSRAEIAAWEHGLRGYDSVHLASALLWNDSTEETVVVSTFDDDLWAASNKEGLGTFPEVKPSDFIKQSEKGTGR